MASEKLEIVRPGTYGTRMLKAGDPFTATGPEARLYKKLGWMKPATGKAAKAETRAVETETVEKPKAAPRKRKAKAKKTA